MRPGSVVFLSVAQRILLVMEQSARELPHQMALPGKSAVCIGETVVDYIAEVDQLPLRNQTVFTESVSRSIGGGSVNVALMLSQTGVHTSLLSFGGENASSLGEALARYPVDLSLFSEVGGDSSSAFIFFCGNDYMTFFDAGNEDRFPFARQDLDLSGFSVICLIGSRLKAYRQLYVDVLDNLDTSDKAVVFCPAWSVELFSPGELRRIIRKTTVLVANQQESEAMCRYLGLSGLSVLGTSLRVVIETCGAEGCIVHGQGRTERVPSIPDVSVVNPSGAGDAFIAGLIFGLLNNCSPVESAEFGCTMASFVLEVPESHLKIQVNEFISRWEGHFSVE